MQFSTAALFSVVLAAAAVAAPTEDVFLMERDADVAAANPIVNLYTDTACTRLAKAVNLGAGSGCITYAAGFSSMKTASNPRSNLGAFTWETQNCADNATSFASLTSTTTCTNVGAKGVQRSFYHN